MQRRRAVDALLGSYLAMVLVPAAVLSGLVTVATTSPATILAAVVAVAAAFALAAAAVDDIADRTASPPVAAATILPPLAYLPYLVFAEPTGRTEWLAIIGLLAVVPGMLVLIVGTVIRNQRLRAGATEHVVVTVGDEDDGIFGSRGESILLVFVTIGALAMIVGTALLMIADSVANTSLLTSLTGLSSLLFLFTDDSTELAVTDAGLRADRSMTPWDDLEGFRVTDDEIEIDRARWWLPTRDFDRDEIDDDAALIEALDEFLPRMDATSEVELAVAE